LKKHFCDVFLSQKTPNSSFRMWGQLSPEYQNGTVSLANCGTNRIRIKIARALKVAQFEPETLAQIESYYPVG
jgi:hypothetical protein